MKSTIMPTLIGQICKITNPLEDENQESIYIVSEDPVPFELEGAIYLTNVVDLLTLWETSFQVDLKEAYHKFGDITNRKKEIPVFLSKLTQALLR